LRWSGGCNRWWWWWWRWSFFNDFTDWFWCMFFGFFVVMFYIVGFLFGFRRCRGVRWRTWSSAILFGSECGVSFEEGGIDEFKFVVASGIGAGDEVGVGEDGIESSFGAGVCGGRFFGRFWCWNFIGCIAECFSSFKDVDFSDGISIIDG